MSWRRHLVASLPLALGVVACAMWREGTVVADSLLLWSPTLMYVLFAAAVVWHLALSLGDAFGTRKDFALRVHLVVQSIAFLWMVGFFGATFLFGLEWGVESTTTDAQGRVFAVLGHGFVDRDHVLASRTADHGIAARWSLVAWGGGGIGEELAPLVVRPASGLPDGLVAHNGVAAVIWTADSGTKCESAATADGRPIVDNRSHAPEFEGVEPPFLRSSPFFLVGPDERPDEKDVATLEAAVRVSLDERRYDLPTDEGLVEALGSANSSVRDAAARIVRAGGAARYPAATKKLP